MFVLILDLVEDFHTVEERRLHRIFCGLEKPREKQQIVLLFPGIYYAVISKKGFFIVLFLI